MLPVTVDFEGGYAIGPGRPDRECPPARRDRRVGCNFEDQIVGTDRLYDIADQVGRLAALREGVGDRLLHQPADRSVPEGQT